MKVLSLKTPVGMSEFLISLLEMSRENLGLARLLSSVPIVITPVDDLDQPSHLYGRITCLEITRDGGAVYTDSSRHPWNCGPEQYSLPILGLALTDVSVHILISNSYIYDPGVSVYRQGRYYALTDGILPPAGNSFWGEERTSYVEKSRRMSMKSVARYPELTLSRLSDQVRTQFRAFKGISTT